MAEIAKVLQGLGYDKIAFAIIILSIFIDISPGIKLNPIKAIFRYLGKAFNSSIEVEINNFKTEMNDKIDVLQNEQLAQRETLDKIILDQADKEICRLRWEIIDFENSIMNGTKHAREQYDHVISSYEKYKKIMQRPDIPYDEYYRKVQEKGEKIQEHYARYNDQNVQYF